MNEPHEREAADDPPPFLGTWRRIYIAVVIYLAATIAAFAWFTGTFNR
jgi:hypothetical protein